MLPANALLFLLLGSIGYLIWEGTGIWGLNNPVGWGWAIINFVWWVGIGHAGTLISAILFYFDRIGEQLLTVLPKRDHFCCNVRRSFPTIHVGQRFG